MVVDHSVTARREAVAGLVVVVDAAAVVEVVELLRERADGPSARSSSNVADGILRLRDKSLEWPERSRARLRHRAES